MSRRLKNCAGGERITPAQSWQLVCLRKDFPINLGGEKSVERTPTESIGEVGDFWVSSAEEQGKSSCQALFRTAKTADLTKAGGILVKRGKGRGVEPKRKEMISSMSVPKNYVNVGRKRGEGDSCRR